LIGIRENNSGHLLPGVILSGWQGAIELRDRVRQTILARLGEPDLAGEFTSLRQMDIALPDKFSE